MPIAVEDHLDAAFAALADPTRRAIVARLAWGDATVTELAEPFAMSLPAVSKHLKVLEKSGLITRSRHAQFRPCHLEREPLDATLAWIEDARRVWRERFDKLDAHLRELQAPSPGDQGHPGAQPGQPVPAKGTSTTSTPRKGSSS